MTLEQAIRARERLLKSLPVTGEILRGSLLERTVFRHKAQLREVCERRRPRAVGIDGHLSWQPHAPNQRVVKKMDRRKNR
jgi:hypothetical protein